MAWFARAVLRLIGWRAVGPAPNIPKFIIVGAHHTSNLDGFLMVAATWVLRIRLYWLGKHTLFRPPFGGLMRAVGGVPINRNTTRNAVEQAVDEFNAHEKMILLIAPEGTRKKVEHWKTGFYYIALGAKVPLVLGLIDYKRRIVGVSDVIIYPTGDIEKDMEPIRAFYANVTPRFPELKGEVTIH
jgi:1-acyl-sn-glycerol-3-phosphate acyltransferase